MTMVYKCPICEGSGKVEYNFYRDKSGVGITEECRACKGKGIIWNYYDFNFPKKTLQENASIDDPCKNCTVKNNPNWNGMCQCTIPYYYNNPKY